MAKGKVFLIGAGPGDPGLLTLKGHSVLKQADVVVYDALLSHELLYTAKPNALKIYVGKHGKQHAMEQRDINELLVRKASQGKVVARLKGGDPFLFGRGGEEAAHLAFQNIPFEVVPGVTSASGVAAYAGIPLTDRRLSSMVTFVTGHEGQEKKTAPVEWARISRESTLVIFMGLDQLRQSCDRLLHHLWDENTPAIAVRWGSTPQQEIVEGTLRDIAAKVKQAQFVSPVLVIIGKVVSLRKKLRWFDSKPLFGRRIVITRAADQAPDLIHRLADTGAEVISFPTIEIAPPTSWTQTDQAIEAIERFDWIVFTSSNGVGMFFQRLKTLGGDIRDLKGLRVAAIGPKTGASLNALGLRVDALPREYRGEALADALGNVKGQRILLAQALVARDILQKTLVARGADVTVATVYRTLKSRPLGDELRKRLLSKEIDVVTFTSSSTVEGFIQHFSARDRRTIFDHTKAAAIGPITAATLKEHGIHPTIRAKRYTTESLADAIVKHFLKRSS